MKTSRRLASIALLLVLPACAAEAQKAPLSLKLIKVFDLAPNATWGVPGGISGKGVIAGTCLPTNDPGEQHAFVRTPAGKVTLLHYPVGTNSTIGSDVNSRGTVCGYYTDPSGNMNVHGFFYTDGVYTTFDVPGVQYTTVQGINDTGDFVGWYDLSSAAYIDIGGVFTPVDFGFDTIESFANAISSNGIVVGDYDTIAGGSGFIRAPDGTLTTGLNFPDRSGSFTICLGVNAQGLVVGRYLNRTGEVAYLFRPPHQWISYTFPGASGTVFTGINDQGLITGYYSDSAAQPHGIILQVVQ